MNQSTVIFGFLFAAFVVYITQRGELPIYLGFLLETPKGAVGAGNTNTAAAKNSGDGIDAMDVAVTAGKMYFGIPGF